MRILMVSRSKIPVFAYGGTERVIWDLGRALTTLGHEVTYLVEPGSTCSFAKVIELRDDLALSQQIPSDVDLVHFHFFPAQAGDIPQPCVYTQHGNSSVGEKLPLNTVFLSRDHAQRHGSDCFVYNGLDWSEYGAPNLSLPARAHAHFLGKAAWRVKNLKGAIAVARKARVHLDVLGGTRLNLKRGVRFTPWPSIHFHGMVGGEHKFELLRNSRALIFPVRWHEPFGLAVIESMFYGAPVFGTPYGALPELVSAEDGVLATDASTLAYAVTGFQPNRKATHERVQDQFNAQRMARDYLARYADVLDGRVLNTQAPCMAESALNLDWLA